MVCQSESKLTYNPDMKHILLYYYFMFNI